MRKQVVYCKGEFEISPAYTSVLFLVYDLMMTQQEVVRSLSCFVVHSGMHGKVYKRWPERHCNSVLL